MALLELQNLSVDYQTPQGTVAALRDVSLSVDKGEIVGIVGESGCGKTTLILSLLRLAATNCRVRGGKILFNGENLLTAAEVRMRQLRGSELATVFQDPMQSLNPVVSIGTQMRDIQRNGRRAEKFERAADMLAHVGIPDARRQLSRYPHQFSGGMLQRIAIGMAMLSRPDLLIADEPTTALDATLEVQIIDKLVELQRENDCGVLLVSHHLNLIADYCRRVVVMYAGEVVEFGETARVFARPQHPYTRRLMECDPGMIKKRTRVLPTIFGTIPDLHAPPAGCVFAPRCDVALPKCTAYHPPLFHLDDANSARCWLVKQ